jgi:hypothetical protein
MMHLKNPKTFNEKIQWLKLYAYKDEYQQMVDKYDARKYIADTLRQHGIDNPNQYLVPLLGVWEKFDDIDFDILPNEFVLKTTHDSGGVHILNKLTMNVDEERIFFNKQLKRSHYWVGNEKCYKSIKPRIIAEMFLSKIESEPVDDIKLICFTGKCKCLFHTTERKQGMKVTFFDVDWNRLPFERKYPALPEDKTPLKPQQLDLMIHLAEILSVDKPLLRIDFYVFEERVYIGELTIYPGSGMEFFNPDIWDRRLGDWLELPEKSR